MKEHSLHQDSANNPVTWKALAESTEGVQRQIGDREVLITSLGRMASERQRIIEELRAWESTVTRRETSPALHATGVAEEASAFATTLDQETRAIEKAVEEVLRVGAAS